MPTSRMALPTTSYDPQAPSDIRRVFGSTPATGYVAGSTTDQSIDDNYGIRSTMEKNRDRKNKMDIAIQQGIDSVSSSKVHGTDAANIQATERKYAVDAEAPERTARIGLMNEQKRATGINATLNEKYGPQRIQQEINSGGLILQEGQNRLDQFNKDWDARNLAEGFGRSANYYNTLESQQAPIRTDLQNTLAKATKAADTSILTSSASDLDNVVQEYNPPQGFMANLNKLPLGRVITNITNFGTARKSAADQASKIKDVLARNAGRARNLPGSQY